LRSAISLIETLIAVSLISVVIGALYKINLSNMKLIDNYHFTSYDKSLLDTFGFIQEEGKVFVYDMLDFQDDDIRLKLKNKKILVKKIDTDTKEFEIDNKLIVIKTTSHEYSLDKYRKLFYRYKLEVSTTN
jgi:DUF438 domain-containing protein